MGPLHEWLYKSIGPDNKMQQDIRYDLMFGVLQDVHAEFCTKPGELGPALERSFNSGKTAVVNALTDPHSHHPAIPGIPMLYRRWFGEERWKEIVPKEFRDLLTEEQVREYMEHLNNVAVYHGL
jgi:hypothetical protein